MPSVRSDTPEEEAWLDERETAIAWRLEPAMRTRLADLADVEYKLRRESPGSESSPASDHLFHLDDVRRVQDDIRQGRTPVPDRWRAEHRAGQTRIPGILARFVLVLILALLTVYVRHNLLR